MKHFLLLLIVFFFVQNTFSQCNPPSSLEELNINNVRAKLLNGGDFWWDGVSSAGYEFPIVDPNSNEIPYNVIFAGAIWLSALDDDDALKVAAMTYRNQGHDFYSGPINSSSQSVLHQDCNAFNRHWEIKRTDVQEHLDNVSEGLPLNISAIDEKILLWPAKGNAHFTAYNIEENLAPFVDLNNNGIYDPENGDYPHIKGDQAIFWVVNDIGGPHDRSGGAPLGVEVQFMAYAYDEITSSLNDYTFYDIKVIKKTVGNLKDFYFGLFVDPNIRTFDDDVVGCNIASNAGFTYNGQPHSYGHKMISTPFLDRDMSSFITIFNALNECRIDPNTAENFRSYQLGLDKCGDSIYIGGNCGLTSISTMFVYPGNPIDCNEWTQGNHSYDNCSCFALGPMDWRYVQNAGPYELNFLESFDITFTATSQFLEPPNFLPNTDSVLVPLIEDLRNLYNDSLVFGNKYDFEPPTSISNLEANAIKIYPNPASDIVKIDFANALNSNLEIIDIQGRKILERAITHNEKNIEINIKDFPSGIYIFSFEINGQLLNYKLVK